MSAFEHLKAVRSLLSDRKKWIKGSFYRGADGTDLFNDQWENSVCFCLMGAVQFVAESNPEFKRALNSYDENNLTLYLNHSLPMHAAGLMRYNDSQLTSHEDILSLIDRAITMSAKVGE